MFGFNWGWQHYLAYFHHKVSVGVVTPNNVGASIDEVCVYLSAADVYGNYIGFVLYAKSLATGGVLLE